MSKGSGDAFDSSSLPSLPSDWRWIQVKEAGEVKLGRQRSPEHHQGKHMRPYLRVANVFANRIDTSDVLQMNFKPSEYETYRLLPGDILLNEGQSLEWVGRPAMYQDEVPGACFQNTLVRFRAHSAVDPRYALYLFLHYLHSQRFQRIAKWTVNIAHLGAGRFAEIEFPLAPLDEQLRIVAKIEELFSDLDAGVAALERARTNLKRYRASLLKSAVDGSLTASQSPDISSLGDLIGAIGQGWSPKCDLNRESLADEWAIIKTTAVQPMKYLDNESKPLPAAMAPRPDIEINLGDFLMTRKGPRVRAGVTCLVRDTRSRLMFCDTVYRFRCDEAKVIPEYLELALNSPDVLSAIDRKKCGISESGVSLTHNKIREVAIPVPSKSEQRRIVAEVSARLSQIEAAETEIDHALHRAARLRQAILKQAFTGKLVLQNPNDEPAAGLLDDVIPETRPRMTPPAKFSKKTLRR